LHATLGYSQPLFGEQYTDSVVDDLGEHTVLRYKAAPSNDQWHPSQLQPGQTISQPAPLFRKLEPEVAEQERQRLRQG